MRKPNKKKRFKFIKAKCKQFPKGGVILSPDDAKYIYERLILDAPKYLTMPSLKDVAEKQKQQDALFDEWFNLLLNKAKERQNKP